MKELMKKAPDNNRKVIKRLQDAPFDSMAKAVYDKTREIRSENLKEKYGSPGMIWNAGMH